MSKIENSNVLTEEEIAGVDGAGRAASPLPTILPALGLGSVDDVISASTAADDYGGSEADTSDNWTNENDRNPLDGVEGVG